MGEAAVREILRKIDNLPESDRLLLERHLAERAELEWHREAQAAREQARVRGLTQEAIDRAVEDVRYRPSADGDRG